MAKHVEQLVWKGDENRAFRLQRPCECGCDNPGIGYLTGSDEDGNGFTVWIETEEIYQAILGTLGRN